MEITSNNTPDEQSLLTVARAKSLLDKEESSSFTSNSSGYIIQNDRIDIRRVDSHNTEESSIFDGLDNTSDSAHPRREFQLEAASPSSSVEVSIQGQMSGEENKSSLWKYSKSEAKRTTRCAENNVSMDEQSMTKNDPSEVQKFRIITSEANADIDRYNKTIAFDQTFDSRVGYSNTQENSMFVSKSKSLLNKDQDHDTFVRSGTRLKSLLDNALRQVAIGVSTEGEVELSLKCDREETETKKFEEESCSSGQKRKRLHNYNDDEEKHASELVREKMTEVMVLKRVSYILVSIFVVTFPRNLG